MAVRATPVTPQSAVSSAPLPPARVGYLLPWGASTAAAVEEALRAGIRIRHAGRPFTLAGRRYPMGTAIVRVSDNGRDLAEKLGPILARHEAASVAVDSGYQDSGISLGSGSVEALKAPRVLLAWDEPAQAQSAGWARFVLERRFGIPVTAVRLSSISRIALHDFDVIVLPSGAYAPLAGEESLRRLREWIRGGGTLVTLADASRWAAGERVNLLETRTELRGGRPETEPAGSGAASAGGAGTAGGAGAAGGAGTAGGGASGSSGGASTAPFDYDKSIQPERERPENTPGALVRVTIDEEHWLSSGQDGEMQALVEGRRVFSPIRLDRGRNVGVYAARDRLVASGLVWDEARDQLARKAYLIHQPVGQGHVIAFAEDPNYRAFTEASQLLFVNAVLLGPSR